MIVDEMIMNGESTITFKVKVSPNARQTKHLGTFGDSLKVSVNAPPEKGKANEALIRFFAEQLSISKKNVEIIAGDTNTLKTIKISNFKKAEFLEKYENN